MNHVCFNVLSKFCFCLGAKVLNMLLKNAKRIHNNGYDTVFVKSGGVKQAEKDFYTWVSPDDAEETITVCMGKLL